MDGYLGQMMVFAGNFAPKNWLFCQGQLLPIANNQALYAILGTYYGGDGISTFGVPDLRSRVPIGTGSAPGITPYPQGCLGGYERIPLHINELPSHDHTASTVFTGGGAISGSATASMAISNSDNSAGEEGNNAFLGKSDGTAIYATTSDGSKLNPNAINVDASGMIVDFSGAHVAVTIGDTGQGQAHYNMQPFLSINWVICVDGLFPQRHD